MVVYIDISKDSNDSTLNENLIDKLNNLINETDNKIFMLIFMEGCGPCIETRPEWAKLKNVLSNSNNDKISNNVIIASIDNKSFDSITNVKDKPSAFPTIRLVTGGGKQIEPFEKDRTIDAFVDWIKNNANSKNTNGGSRTTSKKKHTKSKRRNTKYTKKRKYRKNKNFRNYYKHTQRTHKK